MLMKKWKIGAYYINGFAEFKNGSDLSLQIFTLIEISEEKESDIYGHNQQLKLRNVVSGELVEISQDDRYGRYALLDKKRLININQTFNLIKLQKSFADDCIDVLENIGLFKKFN